MIRLNLDSSLQSGTRAVLDVLSGEGHRALLVGGCVRNALLDEPISDFDIATDALPTQVVRLAEQAGLKPVPTGIAYGTVTVISKGIPHEVTTFRKDVETFGRRAVIAYSSEVADDARRRDFTMNALYAERDGTVIDPLGGLADLCARHVRFIENADLRIKEDYLRILRFFRFHAWYGNQVKGLDDEGLAACAANLDGLDILAKERVGKEVFKLLEARDPASSIVGMANIGCLDRILPGASSEALPALIELEEKMDVVSAPVRRLAVLGGECLAQNLRLSRSVSKCLDLVHSLASSETDPAVLAYRFGRDMAVDVVLVRSALLGLSLPLDLEARLDRGDGAKFPVSAHDLSGSCSGRELGRRLRSLEAAWIHSDFTLDRASLLDRLG